MWRASTDRPLGQAAGQRRRLHGIAAAGMYRHNPPLPSKSLTKMDGTLNSRQGGCCSYGVGVAEQQPVMRERARDKLLDSLI
jgi:hypothetical protein